MLLLVFTDVFILLFLPFKNSSQYLAKYSGVLGLDLLVGVETTL